MPRILAIDPGPEQSAYVVMSGDSITAYGKSTNKEVGLLFRSGLRLTDAICERVRSFGMPAGAELFETCEWSGDFRRQAKEQGIDWHWLTRNEVKNHLCHSSRANDANIRQAIIDRFGGKDRAIGKKKTPGPLYGIKEDMWAALAVALTWQDQHGAGEPRREEA